MERFTQPGFDPCANCGERSHCEHITNPDFTILCGEAEMYKRLAAIEDILGDDYDLDRLRELVEADRKQEFQRHLKRFDIMPPKNPR